MKRPLLTWAVFAVCLAVGLGGMIWLGLTVIRLDQAQADARRAAALEENVRLALWRMDSALAPLIAQESVRPYFTYNSFYPAERAYTRLFAELEHGDVLLPSQLLTFESPYIQLHFQIAPDGAVTSPQVPEGNMRDLAEMGYKSSEAIGASAARLDALRTRLSRERFLAALPKESPVIEAQPGQFEQPAGKSAARQDLSNVAEWQAREEGIAGQKGKVPQKFAQRQQMAQQEGPAPETQRIEFVQQFYQARAAPPELVEETLGPLWLDSELFLARRVGNEEEEYIQGCWLDWPALQQWLTGKIGDLLPDAELMPTAEGDEPGRMLAALPVRLVPGALAVYPRDGVSPIQLSLIVAAACILLAVLAVAVLMRGIVTLSQRRAAFVSAVTHELRTPLTTFQLYTEMLEDGMVTDEAKRRRYFRTLRREAERLAHLIANVLAYARLERVKRASRLERVSLDDLIARTRERLTERAEQAGMMLAVEAARGAADLVVLADPEAIEQILLNLVDNACKYAANPDHPIIHLETRRAGDRVQIAVRDHGPGVSKAEAGRLFRPFHKSAHDAANSAPGVGLGLSLSRRLAHRMGGSLRIDETVRDGARFVLSLPLAADAS